MIVAALIPARFGSKRFPGKMLAQLGNSTVIRMTYQAVVDTGLFDHVQVVTDHERIYREIDFNGGEAVMSLRDHQSGSDRIAEAVENQDFDIIVNVQGDEPFIEKEPLQAIISAFDDETVQVASLMQAFENPKDEQNPNHVKVVTDLNGFALMFSRAPIPYNASEARQLKRYRHIGVYAYRKEALLKFCSLPPGVLEQTEKIEALRMLENGMRIKMMETSFKGVSIDTPGDLEIAQRILKHKRTKVVLESIPETTTPSSSRKDR